MIAIIDYDTGNLRSVCNALRRIGADFILTDDPAEIRNADKVLLPGVGEASSAMAKLREKDLEEVIRSLSMPALGICIGMQLMCRHSEEGNATCMGIFATDVRRLEPAPGIKVPHVGWDRVTGLASPLFKGIPEGEYIYYVHSYAADICTDTIAATEYGREFSAALHKDNFYGVQFHPEKSGDVGERILKNFIEL